MAQIFTPTNPIDLSKEREWASSLGMLDWDATRIVFTKRSLIEFLRTAGITVDTNFSNISKLPKYVTFGKLGAAVPEESLSASMSGASISDNTDGGDAFKPSRRVREAPGGKHTDIFASDFQNEGDALTTAPPIDESQTPASPPIPVAPDVVPSTEEEESGFDFSSKPRPSRRVRTNPGGNSTIGSIFDSDAPAEEFKPTRRVREGPGGADSLWGDSGNTQEASKPTQRAREGPSGTDSFWGDSGSTQEQSKPSRRVREGPGGNDSGSFW